MEENIINIEVEQPPIDNVLTEINGIISLDFTGFEEIPFCLGHENNIDEINLEIIENDDDSDDDFDVDNNNDFETDGDHLFLNSLDFDFDFNINDLF